MSTLDSRHKSFETDNSNHNRWFPDTESVRGEARYHINEPNRPIKDSNESFFEKYSRELRIVRTVILNAFVGAYFAWATYYYFDHGRYFNYDEDFNNGKTCKSLWCDGYGMLFILMVLIYGFVIYFKFIKPRIGKTISNAIVSLKNGLFDVINPRYLAWISIGICLALFIIFVAIDVFRTYDSLERLQSLLGIFILLGIGFIFSKHRSQVNWRTVITGVVLQFLLGVFCIRLETGRVIFECIGRKMSDFFDFAKVGAQFIYGTELVTTLHVFAFAVLPTIFFFSLIVSVLYYYGAMQWVIKHLGCLVQSLLGTTLCESVTVAANIFLGMTESPLLIKPYMRSLTASEIHVVMSSGFATVSGTVLAAYMNFGADASHLITSSIMAVPATLAFSKLIYPETEISQTTSKTFTMEKSSDTSVVDAASNGALAAINLIAGIIANLIAFVSMVAFMNAVISWLGMLIGYDFLTIEWIFGKLFTPLAFIIGIPWPECEKIGSVIATKSIINEFVAYEKLGILNQTHQISSRSNAIATFAICGFANISSLGMMVGNLVTMCPEKRPVITSVSVRALISGSIICFINASIAGLLLSSDVLN